MKKPLSVLPNRYAALDEDGDPAGYVLRVDLRRHSSKPLLLGATRVVRDGKIKVEHVDEPVSVPDLPAYRRMLKTGELLAGDEPTARAAGLPFVPLAEALERCRQRAITDHQAHTGQLPAWATPTANPEVSS